MAAALEELAALPTAPPSPGPGPAPTPGSVAEVAHGVWALLPEAEDSWDGLPPAEAAAVACKRLEGLLKAVRHPRNPGAPSSEFLL